MNDNAKKWVAALRSGDYRQTRGVLSTGRSFCCLGVACEVAIEDGLEVKVGSDHDRMVFFDDEFALLPESVRTWLGLSTTSGDFSGGSLTARNDAGWPFEEIADLIESEPKGLFEDER